MRRFIWTTTKLLCLLPVLGSVAACAAEPSNHATAREVGSNPEFRSMKIRIMISDQVLNATLEDSIPAREFIAQLPLTLQLEDYAATEKIAQLPRRLSVTGEPEGITPVAGDIAFYAPWGNLAIFHKPFGYSKGLIRLGRIEGGLQLLRAAGPVKARIEAF